MSINTKKLCQLLKQEGKNGRIVWTIDEKGNWITDSKFMVRLDKLPTDVLTTLFSIFREIPKAGESFKLITECFRRTVHSWPMKKYTTLRQRRLKVKSLIIQRI